MSSAAATTRRQFVQSTAGAVAAPPRRPHIILLMADSFRHDALGCAGHPVVRTPHLDRLAGEGVRFSRTYCQGPLCQPSRASFLTGRYVRGHGHSWNRMDMKPEWPTMPKALQAAGYHTAVIGKCHFYGSGAAEKTGDLRGPSRATRAFGFDTVLEEYDRHMHARPGISTPYTQYLREHGLLETYRSEVSLPAGADLRSLIGSGPSKVPAEHTQTAFLGDRAAGFIRDYRDPKPLFLWVSFIDPHAPFSPDATSLAPYLEAKIPAPDPGPPHIPDNAWGRYLRTWIRTTGASRLTPETAADAARRYYGSVSAVDRKIGDIVKAVRERGWENDAWIFFTADHGEMMGEHGLMFKNVFYLPSVLVPGIVRPPGGASPRTCDAPVEAIDISATILEAAGARLEGARGRSLAPAALAPYAGREAAFSELAGHNNQGNYFTMAATRRWRYVYDSKNDLRCELFDLEKDPGERRNLVDDPAAKAAADEMHERHVKPFLAS